MVAQSRDRETDHVQSRDGPNRENAHNIINKTDLNIWRESCGTNLPSARKPALTIQLQQQYIVFRFRSYEAYDDPNRDIMPKRDHVVLRLDSPAPLAESAVDQQPLSSSVGLI